MGLFVVAILIAVAGVVAFLFGRRFTRAEKNHTPQQVTDRYGRVGTTSYSGPQGFWFKVGGAGAVALALIFGIVSSYTPIQTPNVGIEVAFGKPVGHLTGGLHMIAPWDGVTVIDGSIQTFTFEGNGSNQNASGGCLTVRIADSQTACVDVSVQAQVNPNGVDTLFRRYNGQGNFQQAIGNSLILRRLEVNLSNTFANYNPVAAINSPYAEGTPKNPNVTQLAANVLRGMQNDIGGLVTVRDVLIPRVTYDPTVEAALQSILKQSAQTAVAQQSIKTAQAQATAIKALQASLLGNPLALVSKCLDIVAAAESTGYQLPAGFGNCVSNSSAVIAAMATGK